MKSVAVNVAPKTPTKPRVPKPGDSPVKKGAATENCDPNFAAKRNTPSKVFRARSAASPKKDLEQLLAPASEEHHACSPVKEEAAGGACDLEISTTPAKASPRKRLEQGLSPPTDDHHASCVAHAKSLQNGSGATTPGRKHICRSARCAANDPDYAVPAPTPPRKFLISKRHILQQQLEESLKRYKKGCPDAGAFGHLDAVENVHVPPEETRTSNMIPAGTGECQPVEELLGISAFPQGMEQDSQGAEQAGMQVANPLGTEEAEGTVAGHPLAIEGMEASEPGVVSEGMKEVVPESMQAVEALVLDNMQAAQPVLQEDTEAADPVGLHMEDVETVVPECIAQSVVPGDMIAVDVPEGEGVVIGATGPLGTEDLKEVVRASESPEVVEEALLGSKEPAHPITLESIKSDIPLGIEGLGVAEAVDLVDALLKDMEAAELAQDVLKSKPSDSTSDAESGESDTSGVEEWVFLDPLTALLDNDIDETLVTDVSGRPSLVGNYLTGRVWGRRKSSTTYPVTDIAVVSSKKQVSSSRKLSSEWKLDNAITKALAGKDPYGEGRVRTLVQAFEKVISLTECDRVLPRHAYRKFSLCARQNEVSLPGPQADSETRHPTDLGVEWVKVDVTTDCNPEDEAGTGELGDGIRDSVASTVSSAGGGSGCIEAFGKQEQVPKDLETVHNNFAGADLWKHSVFAASVTEAEQSQGTTGHDASGKLEDCHGGRGDTVETEGEAAQLGDPEYGIRHSVQMEGPSKVGHSGDYSGDAEGASHLSDSKYGIGYTVKGDNQDPLRHGLAYFGPGHGSDCQHATGYAEGKFDWLKYNGHSHVSESEDGKYGGHAEEFEVHKGDRVSEGGPGTHRRDSSSDNGAGHPCHTGRGASHRRAIPTTEPHPFKLQTEQRGAMHDMAFARKMEEIFAEEARLRIPIARGLPWTTDEPEVVPKPPVKEQTRPVEFRLLSTARAMDRAEFDRYVLDSQRHYEDQRQEEQRLRQMAEEEELRRLRHQMVPRAQLMPYFDQPFQPHRSSKRLTVPKEPNFHSPNKRSKCPCARWNGPSFS